MKKVQGIFFILGLLFSLNFILAELSLPSPPPAPGVDSTSNNASGSSSVPNSYPLVQGNALVNNQNTSSDGSLQSKGIYWASFIGLLIFVVIITGVIIYFIRKHRHVESI